MMITLAFVLKIFVCVFCGVIGMTNLIELFRARGKNSTTSDIYFEKQLWIVISLLTIAIVLGNL